MPLRMWCAAASFTRSPPNDPFAIPLAGFNRDMNINATSAFVDAQQAVLGFADLPADVAKSFFYMGNILNVAILPSFMDAGTGKSAAARMMNAAVAAYQDRGYEFYYVDERKADGGPIFKVSGEAHGSLLWELAQAQAQGPWLQSFVKGVEYKDFGPYRL
ncbi:hypothetical protein Hte_002534 [Hypoxylon texense]